MAGEMFSAILNSNVNVSTQGGDTAKRQAADIANSEDRTLDVVKLGQGVSNIMAREVQAKDTAETNRAKQHLIELTTSSGYLDAKDTRKAEMLEEFYYASTDQSQKYQDSIKGYSSGEYTKVYEGREKEARVSELNNFGADYTAYLENTYEETLEEGVTTNRDAGKTLADYIDERHAINPTISKVEFGQAGLNEEYGKMYVDVASARTPEELTKVQGNISDIKSTLQSNFLLNSNEKAAVAANTQRETQLNSMIKGKQKEFKLQSKSRIAQAEKGYESNKEIGPNPTLLATDILRATSDDLAAKHQYDSLKKQYDEQIVRVNFLNSNIPGEKVIGNVPKEAKEAWQQEVNKSALNAIQQGDYSTFINTVNFSPDESKEVGNNMYQAYLQTKSSKEAKPLLDFLLVTSRKPGGATALRQSLGDDQYVEIMTSSYLAESLFEGDMMKARTYYQQKAENVSSVQIPFEDQDDIMDYVGKLGPHKDKYLTTMKHLYNIDPQLAHKQYKNIGKFYKDQMKSTSIGDNSVIEDNSMVDFDSTSGALNLEEVKTNITKEFTDTTGFTPGSITYMPGGTALVTDSVTGFGHVVNTGTIVAKSNDNVMEAARVEKARKDNSKREREGSGGSLSDAPGLLGDNLPGLETPIKIVQGLGGVLSKFGNYLSDQWDKDIENLTRGIGLLPKSDKEAIEAEILKDEEATQEYLDALDKVIIDTPTKVDEPAHNTLSFTNKAVLRNAIEKNKAIVNKAKKSKESFVGPEDINERIKHVESRGVVDANRTGSDYYGLYQIGSEEARSTFKETGLNEKTWKTEEGQEKTFNVLKKMYTKELKEDNIPINALTIYGRHQQGRKGFREIYRGGQMTKARVKNMRGNLPGHTKYKDHEVRDAWITYWQEKI